MNRINEIINKIRQKHGNSKCPNCGEYCITYKQKQRLADFRFCHKCKLCGKTIKLVGWYMLIRLGLDLLTAFLVVKFKYNYPVYALIAILHLISHSIYFPYVPIVG